MERIALSDQLVETSMYRTIGTSYLMSKNWLPCGDNLWMDEEGYPIYVMMDTESNKESYDREALTSLMRAQKVAHGAKRSDIVSVQVVDGEARVVHEFAADAA